MQAAGGSLRASTEPTHLHDPDPLTADMGRNVLPDVASGVMTPPAASLRQVFCLDQSMTSAGASDETRVGAELAVWFGGASVACWLCCPFWILVCFIALPLALVGLVRACVEYRASTSGRASRPRAVVGALLSLLGATAAITYMIFLANHPELPVQG